MLRVIEKELHVPTPTSFILLCNFYPYPTIRVGCRTVCAHLSSYLHVHARKKSAAYDGFDILLIRSDATGTTTYARLLNCQLPTSRAPSRSFVKPPSNPHLGTARHYATTGATPTPRKTVAQLAPKSADVVDNSHRSVLAASLCSVSALLYVCRAPRCRSSNTPKRPQWLASVSLH